jgi:hypothetical protein
MQRRPNRPELHDQILTMYTDDETWDTICETLKCSRSTVARVVKTLPKRTRDTTAIPKNKSPRKKKGGFDLNSLGQHPPSNSIITPGNNYVMQDISGDIADIERQYQYHLNR